MQQTINKKVQNLYYRK